MSIFTFVLLAFIAMIGLMSIGVINGRKPLKGSCGGVGAALGETDYECPVCGNNPAKCPDS